MVIFIKKHKYFLLWLLCLLVLVNIKFIKNIKLFVEEKKINYYFQMNSTPDSYVPKNNDFIMILEIPKLNLKKGIYNFKSKYNSVDYGIELLTNSKMPTENSSTLFLASHSGSSAISYFHNLKNLIKEDLVKIYYQQNIYLYQIEKVVEINKNGYMMYPIDNENNQIALITCHEKDKNKQIVYIGNLTKIMKI